MIPEFLNEAIKSHMTKNLENNIKNPDVAQG
jgi:hypothetical protein